LILIADGFHNLIDGLAIGAALTISTELGIVTWLVLGSTVILGGVIAGAFAGHASVAVPLPFAAGNFAYIALADLVPELTTSPAPHEKAILTGGFAAGLLLLALTAALAHRAKTGQLPRTRFHGPQAALAEWALHLPLRARVHAHHILQPWRHLQRRVGDYRAVDNHYIGGPPVAGMFKDLNPVRAEVISLQDPLHLLPPTTHARTQLTACPVTRPGHVMTKTPSMATSAKSHGYRDSRAAVSRASNCG
jgi:hypothetical protein